MRFSLQEHEQKDKQDARMECFRTGSVESWSGMDVTFDMDCS